MATGIQITGIILIILGVIILLSAFPVIERNVIDLGPAEIEIEEGDGVSEVNIIRIVIGAIIVISLTL